MSQFSSSSFISCFINLLTIFSIFNYTPIISANLPTIFESPSTKNATFQDVIQYYEDLYLRLSSKDYGFAQFGESCKVSTTHEIEDHLNTGNSIIKEQGEDHNQVRRAVEEHLHPKLRNFFYQSKSICDFLKLLICNPTGNHCVCADDTMGIGRNGSCQIKIGKRCDLNSTYLAERGIPSRYPVNLNCISQGECVTGLGADSKFCRCKPGFFGSGCKTWMESHHMWDREGSAEVAATVTGGHQIGRGFGRKMEKPSINPGPANTEEHFLYPEEIRSELTKLMNFRQVFNPEEQEAEATELYDAMENDAGQEEMVVRDIHLRRLASLKHGESCNPGKQVTLDNPPLAKDGSTWVDPKQEVVKQWQLHLLQDSKPICNFAKFLRCNPFTKTCECKEGLVLESNTCRLPLGKPCGSDYDGVYEFDPLKNVKRFTSPVSPDCISGSNCKNVPFFFMKQCWCEAGPNCGNSSELPDKFMPLPANLSEDIQSRFSLNLGEICNPQAQSFLLDPKNAQVLDYTLRTATLLAVLSAKPAVQFCNINKLLNCSHTTTKCECFQSLIEENGICRSPNLYPCESAFPFGNQLYPSGPMLWKIEDMFNTSFSPQCTKYARCGNGKITGKCVCQNGKAGPLCEDSKSIFASVLNPANVKGYYRDGKINELFHALNHLTYNMEQVMTLSYGDECKPESANLAERIQGFYIALGSSKDTTNRGKTLHQYRKVAKWVQHLLKSGVSRLCNLFVGLNCNPISKKCSCGTGTAFEDNICKLLPGQNCNPNPVAGWIPTCRKNSHCQQNKTTESESKCTCNKGRSGVDCKKLHSSLPSHSLTTEKIGPTENCTYSNITITIGRITITECLNPEPNSHKVYDNIDDTALTDSQIATDKTKFQNISLILNRIMNNRVLGLHSVCDPELESELTSLFPSLPHFKVNHYNSLPEKESSFGTLQRIDSDETKFCDRKRYLVCNDGTRKCDCNLSVYVKEGSEGGTECRLKEGSFCDGIGTVNDRNLNYHPKCQRGTTCSKFGYGVATCISEEDY